MSILSRVSVLAVVCVGVLSALVHGQFTQQPNAGAQCTGAASCSVINMYTPSATIALGLTYDPSGNVCSLSGQLSVSKSGAVVPQGTFATIQAVTPVTGATNKVRVGTENGSGEEVITASIGFTATYSINGGATQTATGTIIGNLADGGAILVFTPFFGNTNEVAQAAFSDTCSGGAAGDPLFSGFLGQQFYVEGKDNQVINMLSTFNMQLNGRFVTLEEGAALYPNQQEKIQLESVIAHQAEPSVAAFPVTTAWNHPGTYFGEIGVALLAENRVHAKAGSFATGFAKVTLNGRNLPVSDDFVVLGSGSNTTFVQRVSAHELTVRTVNVEFTVVNSDNFLNVEHLHLERGSKKFNHFAGLLGQTTTLEWTFETKAVEDAFVESNNLFERETVEA